MPPKIFTTAFILTLCLPLVAQPPQFDAVQIDPDGHGRTAIGDIDGDGYNDIVLHTWSNDRGKQDNGTLSWYRYPDWQRFLIKGNQHFFGDGVVIVDLDADGDNDVVSCKGNDGSAQVWWFENPGGDPTRTWNDHRVDEVETQSEVKDIEVHDIDGDEKEDIVVRTKHFFVVYFQDAPNTWTPHRQENEEREGMTLGDVDNDGDIDAVMNGFWLECPADPRNDNWQRHVIHPQWFDDLTGGWQDHSVMAATADFNGDGKTDIVLSHSEKTGFDVTWYESLDPLQGEEGWKKHPIQVVDYCHTLRAADLDNDGDQDIVAATLIRTDTPAIYAFLNNGDGTDWTTRKIADHAAYKAKTGDIDNDGDIDIVTSRFWAGPPLMLWRNKTSDPPQQSDAFSFKRRLIDKLPSNAVYVLAEDLDGRPGKEIVAGAWWFSDQTHEIGEPLRNAFLLHDVDGDGDTDIIGTKGVGASANADFVWAENDGHAAFTIHDNIPSGTGDFLQGVAAFEHGGRTHVALSWHRADQGIQLLTIPEDPARQQWTWSRLSDVSQDEDLSAGDIDRDGDTDLYLGTSWIENPGSLTDPWPHHPIGSVPKGVPDRNDLADINGDGRLDAVVGLENGTDVFWFEAPEDPTAEWQRHLIGSDVGGGFSMDTADADGDGDPDVVLGEHRGNRVNRVILYENSGGGSEWTAHEIDRGPKNEIDHHDGTRFVDVDEDGDLDLISVGWYNPKVWLYENHSAENEEDTAMETESEGIKVTDNVEHQGAECIRIETPTATWIYDKAGGGFASVLDPQGNDWISYKPGGGPRGEFRGIPNAGHPGGFFHPGFDNCTTEIAEEQPSHVRLHTVSKDDEWECTWNILPDRAHLTISRFPRPHWFLYEGTPNGDYDETAAFMVDSSGRQEPCTRVWQRRLPDPRWIYFTSPDAQDVLYLMDQTERDDPNLMDSFWSMQESMTVFGFGRMLGGADNERWKHLDDAPAYFTVGLMPKHDENQLKKELDAIFDSHPRK